MTIQEKNFIESCFDGNLKSIKTCIKHGVDIHVEDDWCIEIASRKDHHQIILFLLENGISHVSAAGKSLLAFACINENFDLLRYLIKNSNAYKNDKAAISWAASTGNVNIVEYLMGYVNNYGGVFCRAAEKGHINILKFLIDNDIQELDCVSNQSIFWAAEKNQWDSVKLLIDNNIGASKDLGKYLSVYDLWLGKNLDGL